MTKVKMPEPEGRMPYPFGHIECYSKEKMKQYGDDRAREAMEMAADTCDSTLYIEGNGTVSKYGPMTHANLEIKKCADAIRALAKEIK